MQRPCSKGLECPADASLSLGHYLGKKRYWWVHRSPGAYQLHGLRRVVAGCALVVALMLNAVHHRVLLCVGNRAQDEEAVVCITNSSTSGVWRLRRISSARTAKRPWESRNAMSSSISRLPQRMVSS